MRPKTNTTILILAVLLCLANDNHLIGQSKNTAVEKGDSANAQQQPRLWASKNGKFKITAALIACDQDSATLQKTDGSTIDVPLNKLCQADRLYLKAHRKRQSKATAAASTNEGSSKDKPSDGGSAMVASETTTVPELLPLEEYEGIKYESSQWAKWDTMELLKSDLPGPEVLEPDSMVAPSAEGLKEAGMLLEEQGMHQTVDAVLPVGGPNKLLMLGLSGLALQKQYDLGAVFWLSLEQQKVLGKVYLPAGEEVIDYAPAFGRLLTVADRSDEGFGMGKGGNVSLTLWDLPPGGKKATALGRWRTMIGTFSKEKQQARIVSEDLVIYSLSSHSGIKYSVVNVAEKKAVYDFVLKPVFAFDLKVLFSPNRRYLFVPVSKGVIVKDSRSGENIAGLRCDSPIDVACTSDGKRIAAITPEFVHVWEIGSTPSDADGESIKFAHQQSSISGHANLDWVNDKLLMMGTAKDTRVLINVERQYPVWEYKFDKVLTGPRHRGDPLVEIANGYLVYPIDSSGATAVGCVKLPGAGVVESAQDFDPASVLIMKRGTEVKLTIKSEQDQDRIRETIEKKIRDNGWVISDAAKIEVLGTLNRTQIKDRIRLPDKNERSGYAWKEISYYRVGYSVRINTTWRRRGWEIDTNQSIWSGSILSSDYFSAEAAQSLQDAKKMLETVDLNFFEKIDIPAEIVDPRAALGAGWTIVNRNGLDKQE